MSSFLSAAENVARQRQNVRRTDKTKRSAGQYFTAVSIRDKSQTGSLKIERILQLTTIFHKRSTILLSNNNPKYASIK